MIGAGFWGLEGTMLEKIRTNSKIKNAREKAMHDKTRDKKICPYLT